MAYIKDNIFIKQTKEELAACKAKELDVYIDNDGIARCKKCNQPRMWYYEEYDTWLGTCCNCVIARDESDRRKAEIHNNTKRSGIIGRLLKADLNKMEVPTGNKAAYNACAKYVGCFDTCLERGLGIYLYGTEGCGKTYLACATGNELLKAGYVVKYASVSDILIDIRATYNRNSREDEKQIISKYSETEFLIIDDIGNDKYNKNNESSNFAQEKLFSIINRRNLNELPTFFISVYSLDELYNKSLLLPKTVRSINEMASKRIEMRETYIKKRSVNEEW